MAERAPIGRPYGGSGKRAACLRPSVGAAIGRQPKAKLPVCGKPPETHRAERAPIGRPYGAPGSKPHRLGLRVGAAIGRPFRMLYARMPSIFRSVMQSRYPC